MSHNYIEHVSTPLTHASRVTVTEPEHIPQGAQSSPNRIWIAQYTTDWGPERNRTKVEPQPACIDLRFQPGLYSRVKNTKSIKFAEAKHAQGPSMHRAGTKHIDNRMHTLEQPREATMQPGV